MEKKLQFYIGFFNKTLNLPGIAWWVIDFEEDPNHFYCNENMVKSFYLDPELEKHSIELTCPITGDYNKQIAEADQEIAEKIFSDYNLMIEGKKETYNNRFPFYCRETQKTHYFSNRAKVLEACPNGTPRIIYGIIEDVTIETKKTAALERLSERDPLTGLYNRIKLDDFIYREIERFKRHQTPLSVLFIDLDDFKEVNDTYGHQSGDLILIQMADIFEKLTRDNDIVGRWGGEEFMIICPHTSISRAKTVSENMLVAVEEHDFKRPPKISISIGLTEFETTDSLEQFIKRADLALYESKNNGKGQVTIL